MSYCIKEEWTVLPEAAPAVSRNCPGCRKKSIFKNSGNFRINANGNKIDVWLIYRCEKCDTSWNMDIYTRISPGALEKDLYDRFLSNDKAAAMDYGCRKEILNRNKAEALWEQVPLKIDKTCCKAKSPAAGRETLETDSVVNAEVPVSRILSIHNHYGIPLRLDKLLCSEWGCSRKKLGQMEESGLLCIRTGGKNSRSKIPEYIEVEIKEPSPRG